MKNILLVIDGNNVLNRGYHAVPFMSSPTGIPTNAVKGAMNIIFKHIAEYRPTHIAAVFDHPSKNFRHDLFPEYKGNRERDPEKHERLAPQKILLRQMLKSIGIKVFHKRGLEADDVIGTIVKYAVAQGFKSVVIVSNDKDFAQLLEGPVRMLRVTGSGEHRKEHLIKASNCVKHFLVNPDQIVDMLMMLGDKVDNIPGVKGLGDKRASTILQTHGTLKEAMASGKVAALNGLGKQFKLTRKLITIKTNIFDPDFDKMLVRKKDLTKFKAICDKHKMSSLQGFILKVMRYATK